MPKYSIQCPCLVQRGHTPSTQIVMVDDWFISRMSPKSCLFSGLDDLTLRQRVGMKSSSPKLNTVGRLGWSPPLPKTKRRSLINVPNDPPENPAGVGTG